ncbi:MULTISPECIES: Sir2 family NAD-dependent protein deacetylase [Kocuria]|uniref:protein acetyllysine N-acetyltransferase n=1 Tax=Kocuria gwangalliensis TaxID=501592 RepID=A0ABP8WQ84_9MICC|nr:Sir2 family NAD-dependent protein deacetylase [Kocuria sp.]MDO5368518.1 Sir2 family NAD-dependent protein deacetylase [Kocuria sp.]
MPVRVIRAGYGAPLDATQFPDPHALDAAAGLPAAVSALSGRRLAVLTGAGVSTDSGIPDYRGPGAKPRTPMTYQQFMGSERMRRHYWARNQFGWHFVAQAKPSEAHAALAELEHRGSLCGIITQNIDRLHQKAGCIDVLDLHGTHQRVICTRCRSTIPRAVLSDRLDALNPGFYDDVATRHDIEYAPDADATIEHTEHFNILDCPVCGGILKPDVVFFGENAPAERVRYAKLVVDRAEALLVVGTSLTVNSGKRYVRRAVSNGIPVVIVNHGVTGSDHLATVKVDAFVGGFLRSLTNELLRDLD